jgi:hypothetical protein
MLVLVPQLCGLTIVLPPCLVNAYQNEESIHCIYSQIHNYTCQGDWKDNSSFSMRISYSWYPQLLTKSNISAYLCAIIQL